MDIALLGSREPVGISALSVRWPALVPGLSFVFGVWVAPAMSWIPVGPLALLTVLLFATGRYWGRALGCLCLGLVHAAVSWVLPAREVSLVDLQKTVTVVFERNGHWRQRPDGWQARAEVIRLRQDSIVDLKPRDVWVWLPGEEPPPAQRRLRALGRLELSQQTFNGGPPRKAFFRLFLKSRRLLLEQGQADLKGAVVWAVGRRIRDLLGEHFPPSFVIRDPGRNLAGALLLGDGGRLDPGMNSSLRAAGLAHLTAVSGLHLGLVTGLALVFSVFLGRRFRAPFVVIAALGYLSLVGARSSLVRSFLMLCAAIGSRGVSRGASPVNGLMVAAVALLLAEPAQVLELGFRLSFAATGGLLVLAPLIAHRFEELCPRLPAFLRQGLSASLGAQLGSLPLSLPSFSLLTPWAPLLNLLYVPTTALLLAVSLLTAMLSALSERAVVWGAPLLNCLALPFVALAEISLPVALSVPSCAGPLASVGLSLAVYCLLTGRRHVLPRVALVVVATMLVSPSAREGVARPSEEEVFFLDVGQGDATLLRSRGKVVLVDGGGWRRGDIAGRILVPVLAREGIRKIDLMVMTHPDRDHCGGLVDLSRYVPVRELWVASGWGERSCGKELVSRLHGRSRKVVRGDSGVYGHWRLEVLWSGDSTPGRIGSSNRGSIVLLARHGERSLLLTADIDQQVERTLLAHELSEVDWLKVAHHGSRSSSLPAFLDRVDPETAILSVGRNNPYGHPSKEVLRRLSSRGIEVLRTDWHGGIKKRLDLGTGRFETALPGPVLKLRFAPVKSSHGAS